MSIAQQLKSMDPRKAAARIMSMSAADRRQALAEHLGPPFTQNGVTWQTQGEYSEGTVQITFTASPVSPTDAVVSAWCVLANGTGSNAPGLSCNIAGVDGLQATGSPSSMTGISTYVAQAPQNLAPVLTATLYANLASGGSSQIQFEISTTGAASAAK